MSPDVTSALLSAGTAILGSGTALLAYKHGAKVARRASGPTLWDQQIVENERRHVDTGTTALAAKLSPAPPRWVEGTEAWCEPAQETIEKIDAAWWAHQR